MATDQDFIGYVCEQVVDLPALSYRKMFGEYALYVGNKVAFACDNQLFVKPTDEGAAFAGEVTTGAPYPGAKPYMMVNEQLDDAEWISQLIRITYNALPEPKPKKPKSSSGKSSRKSSL
jgi:TfoX/Sxy family transcriptional regulator of competence genes